MVEGEVMRVTEVRCQVVRCQVVRRQGVCRKAVHSWMLMLTALAWFAVSGVTQALPPKHEMNRLLLSAEKALAAENWDKAQGELERISQLEVEPPEDYHFYMGQVLAQKKAYDRAKPFLENYIVKAGEEGKYYNQALMLVTEAEEFQAAQQVIKPSPTITYSSGEGGSSAAGGRSYSTQRAGDREASAGADEYLVGLRKLYLTKDDQTALVLHINTLLGNHPYYGDRIKKQQRDTGVDTQLDVDASRDLIIKEKHYHPESGARLNVVKQSVFGIDPIVRYGCNMGEYVCWLYHPVHQHERWILMDRDDQAAAELALAMSRLIRLLQR